MQAIETYTYSDYELWEGDWELIYGMPLAMTPSPGMPHQVLAGNFLYELKRCLETCSHCQAVSKIDWKIQEDIVVRPDVVMVCNEPGDKYLTRTPQIIIEVVSPSSARRDENTKLELYEREQCPYYVLAYPLDKMARIYKLIDSKFIKQGEFIDEIYDFQGLDCPVTIDFRRIFK